VARRRDKNNGGCGQYWDKHHIIPSSRSGDGNKRNMIFRIPVALHKAYHDLFGNLTPLEVIALLFRVFFRPGRFKEYIRVVGNGVPPPKLNPDKLLLDLVRLFPEGWALTDELIGKIRSLTEQRDKLT
jgi:hypothetical protein